MSEPTIDEMLAIVDSAIFNCTPDDAVRLRAAIRAILEQHRDDDIIQRIASIEIEKECERQKLEAIRAFVERVRKRVHNKYPDALSFVTQSGWEVALVESLLDELAAMESEVKE